MKSKLWILALAVLAISFAIPASATTITYTTSGVLSCGANANCTGSGSSLQVQSSNGNTTVTISFNGLTSQSVNTAGGPPETTVASFGNINIDCTGNCTQGGANLPNIGGLSLVINIAESAPGSGSSAIPAGAITGTVNQNSSSAQISWSSVTGSPTVTGGGFTVTYSIANTPLALVPSGTNDGNTSVQGMISDVASGGGSTTPEPTSMLLFGSGFLALGLVARRKRS